MVAAGDREWLPLPPLSADTGLLLLLASLLLWLWLLLLLVALTMVLLLLLLILLLLLPFVDDTAVATPSRRGAWFTSAAPENQGTAETRW